MRLFTPIAAPGESLGGGRSVRAAVVASYPTSDPTATAAYGMLGNGSTRIEPAKSLYARVPEGEAIPGMLDAAIWVGYAWADEPRCRAAAVVTGDDEATITEQARGLAEANWKARADFAFVAPTGNLEDCVRSAIDSDARPFLISNSGDNPTAGGAGDVSATLEYLLGVEELRLGKVGAIYASIVDPEAVDAAFAMHTSGNEDLRWRTTAYPARPRQG
ncbi:MAG: M81 family metallopeptidase [Actinoallomurus sp.]